MRSHVVLILDFLAVALLAIALPAFAVEKERLILSSGPGLVTLALKYKADFEKESNVVLQIHAHEGVMGPSSLILIDSGKVDVGIHALDWESTVNLVKEKGYVFKGFEKIHRAKIGESATAIVTSKGGPNALSNEQIEKIFTGKVTNWQELGGADLPIQVVAPIRSQSTLRHFRETMLNGEALRPKTTYLDSYPKIVDFVAETPGAVAIISREFLSSRLNHPKHAPMIRTVYFITSGEPSAKAKKLLEYVRRKKLYH